MLLPKLQFTGVRKSVVVAASGFQSGAFDFAKAHGIACVRLVDNAWMYVSRHTVTTPPPALTGAYTGYAMTPDGEGEYEFTLLTGGAENRRSALVITA
ncbi:MULTISPECIES: hypothetical protein [Micromonospora]|uniref:Restriction endonuclease n=1 Tax=Micromonospora solifontis TaxID=2487138 RepID=A0ABX9W8S5_9ACTN|nr:MULTISPECIES: hypothetical protein [Micromonospora]NES17241.1 hypothetical protein [Micromonospora sp. PPF5-17B]NES39555.1 hypothetical protein [Micromonospora solifontis]NES59057.1 hypothetical protein [Micromonospora sp. PPF5-6]RNL88230.1 hypothetical protein EFE23_26105 [Micromonospora solifontis]